MIVSALFTGSNTLGYKKGNTYTLVLKEHNFLESFLLGYKLEIERINGGGWCPYTTKESFKSNWTILVILRL